MIIALQDSSLHCLDNDLSLRHGPFGRSKVIGRLENAEPRELLSFHRQNAARDFRVIPRGCSVWKLE